MLRSLLGTGGTLQHHSYLAATRCRRNLHRNLPFQIQIEAPTSRRASGLLHVQPTSKIPRNTAISGISRFHSTPRRQGAPIVPLLLGALKVRQLSFFDVGILISSLGFDGTWISEDHFTGDFDGRSNISVEKCEDTEEDGMGCYPWQTRLRGRERTVIAS